MYVCVCNALREDDIATAAVEFPDATAEEVYAELGAQPDCGTCLIFARHVIDKARAKHAEGAHAVVP